MDTDTPEHHIHHTLENIKREAEENPSSPVTNTMIHRVAFLDSKLAESSSNGVQKAYAVSKSARNWALAAAFFSFVQAVFAVLAYLKMKP